MVPDASDSDIQEALVAAHGDADEAASKLLGVQADSDDEDLMLSVFDDVMPDDQLPISPTAALIRFQNETSDSDRPSQLFRACRLDGQADFRREIMGIYKNPNTDLKAKPRVRFEDEEAVGEGPIREFLSQAIRLAEEGIPSTSGSKPLIFFEGEKDHLIPIHDHSLRLTGAFKTIGRIIGHSMLHGGPGLTGLSPAVKHCLCTPDHSQEPPPISIQDIPDVDLRELITNASVTS
ncbi:PREDICTED: uncharacterized protein LOC107346751 [Acropora digitifera]|uniref:uncharacterized protein LOC107346751 n=1 Tax=Acropora digitifera TaxID=70779 RepID=UPI00077A3DE8|nr:PREDICTED: uncharacterized protein LOC107346751 [Acropora digitifera]